MIINFTQETSFFSASPSANVGFALINIKIKIGRKEGKAGLYSCPEMAKILVLYYSKTGNTKRMAEAVAEGAQKKAEEVNVVNLQEATVDILPNYDGIIIGSPTYYGIAAGAVKEFLDKSIKYHGQLEGKVGGAFSSAGIPGGGCETTAISIIQMLLVHGMVVKGFSKTGHYGPVATGAPDERALSECQQLGEETAEIAQKLKS